MACSTCLVSLATKNSSRHLQSCLNALGQLNYPHDKLRFVFAYGKSNDNTLDIIEGSFRGKDLEYEIYPDPEYKNPTGNSLYIAESMNVLSTQLKDEDFVLFLDSDITEIPPDTLTELVKLNKDIVAPLPQSKLGDTLLFYDRYAFRINGKTTEYLQLLPDHSFFKQKHPVEMTSVGTCILVKREVAKKVRWKNPFPMLRYCQDARRLGYRIWAVPYLTVIHGDITGEESHKPLEYYIEKGIIPQTELDKIKEI